MKSSKQQYKYAIRRLKRASEKINGDKFLDQILAGGCNIFTEIKRFRGKTKTCRNISNIYSKLHSKVDHDKEFHSFVDDINTEINSKCEGLEQVTEHLIGEALKKMKPGKNDGLYDFSSDSLMNDPLYSGSTSPISSGCSLLMGRFLSICLSAPWFPFLRIV